MPDVTDVDDVGVVQAFGRLSLGVEPFLSDLGRLVPMQDHFQSKFIAGLFITSQVDDAHAASPNFFQQHVLAKASRQFQGGANHILAVGQ